VLTFVVGCGNIGPSVSAHSLLEGFWVSGNFSHTHSRRLLLSTHPSAPCTKSIVLFIQPWRPLCL